MKQKSGWKRITLLRKTSFKKRLKILAGYKRQPGSYQLARWLVPTKRTCVYQLDSLCLGVVPVTGQRRCPGSLHYSGVLDFW